MSGSNTSAPGSAASSPEPLSFTVHNQPDPRALPGTPQQRTGRLKMLLVLAVCAAPVIASLPRRAAMASATCWQVMPFSARAARSRTLNCRLWPVFSPHSSFVMPR